MSGGSVRQRRTDLGGEMMVSGEKSERRGSKGQKEKKTRMKKREKEM
jgi:hypothetical protein